ncbi:MAG: hypothetical protein ACYCYO_22905, partial [Bacilli bacterium]
MADYKYVGCRDAPKDEPLTRRSMSQEFIYTKWKANWGIGQMFKKSFSVITSLGLAVMMVSGYGATPSFAASPSHVTPIKNITIGYSVSTLQNQFFVGLTQGVER